MSNNLSAEVESICPQIKKKHVSIWVNEAINVAKKELDSEGANVDAEAISKKVVFQAKRTSALSAYELSLFIGAQEGKAFFGNDLPETIIKQKIGITFSTFDRAAFEKIIVCRGIAEKRFEKRNEEKGLQVAQDIMEKVKQFNREGSPEHPWMRLKVDNVYRDKDGQVWVSEHKFPNNPNDYSSEKDIPEYSKVNAEYVRLILSDILNVKVDHVVTNYFDYQSFDIKSFEISEDPILKDKLMRAGEMAWKHIVDNTFPAISKGKDFKSIDDLPGNLQRQVANTVVIKSLLTQLKKNYETTSKGMMKTLSEFTDTQAKGKIRLPFLDVSRESREYDSIPAMLEFLREKGIDIDDPKLKTLYDPKVLKNAIYKLGADPECSDFKDIKSFTKLTVPTAKSYEHREAIDLLKDSLNETSQREINRTMSEHFTFKKEEVPLTLQDLDDELLF